MSYGRFAAPHWRLHPITRRPNSPVSPGLHSRGGAYSSEVSGRMAQNIGSVSAVLSLAANNSTPCNLPAGSSQVAEDAGPAPIATNNLHQAFERAANDLASRHKVEAFAKFPQLREYVGAQAPVPTHAALQMTTSQQPSKTPSRKRLAPKRAGVPSRKPKRRP